MSQNKALHYATIAEIAPQIRQQRLSPVELTETMLARIEKVDAELNSYATVMGSSARQAAERATREIRDGHYRGPLHGIPVAVKDLCYTRGTRTMGGLKVLRDFVPDVDSTVVARLEAAGAILLGKLNLTEGAMGGYHRDFDIPVNPWNPALWAGASSSGSGVATAAGLCFASLGSDTGGSIRFPSTANSVVGLKPTWGRVSRYGILALSETLDHVGPMTRSVADAATVFSAIAGVDLNDPTSLPGPVPDMSRDLHAGVDGLRIGYDANWVAQGTEPGLVAAIEAALTTFRQLGCRVENVTMPATTSTIGDIWFSICSAEACRAHAAHFPSRADEYGAYFGDFLRMGAEVTEQQYADAMACRYHFSQQFEEVLSSVDLMVCPAGGATVEIPPAAQYGGADAIAPYMDKLQMQFTIPADFAGTPALTLPCGRSGLGNPYGLQLMGPRLSESLLCRAGHAYEKATHWHEEHPPIQ